MTNSPPANVRHAPDHRSQSPASPLSALPRVLACGVDTLYLAVDLRWPGDVMFGDLRELKATAAETEREQPGKIFLSPDYLFTVRPYGKKGYEWLLDSSEFRMDLGSWKEPGSRPSAMIYVGSETLWATGTEQLLERVRAVLTAAGAEIVKERVSRVDLCVDLLMSEADWHPGIAEFIVSRARSRNLHFDGRTFTGLSIGRGEISARIYDKAAEIKAKRDKGWFYDVWKLDGVPPGQRVIRVEFQLRREALTPLKIDTTADLMRAQSRLWAYCSDKWLKMMDHPERHVTRRRILPWWAAAQAGYTAAQDGLPLVREKASKATEEQLTRQLLGNLSSLVALRHRGRDDGGMYTVVGELPGIYRTAHSVGYSDERLTEDAMRKAPRFARPAISGAGAPSPVSCAQQSQE